MFRFEAGSPTVRRLAIGGGIALAGLIVLGGVLCRFVFNCHLHGGSKAFTKQELKLPDGFEQETVVRGLEMPVSFAFVGDGRILIAEKRGVIRVWQDGVLRQQPFLDISSVVDGNELRGVLGLAVDPNFDHNGFVYVDYVHRAQSTRPGGPWNVRVSRFVASGARASAASERVIVGAAGGSDCRRLPARADCIPLDGYHAGGDLAFAPDGTLFITTGDGGRGDPAEAAALRAQSLDSLGGKVLHVTRNGAGLRSNPFWKGNSKANRSKIWASGLRNPFRFSIDPQTGVVYAGDVGWNRYEEVDAVLRGGNYGWPCYEGPVRTPTYSSRPVCRALFARGPGAVVPPLVFHDHHRDGNSVIGGVIYRGTRYPSFYRGAYLYGDFGRSWVRAIRLTRDGRGALGQGRLFVDGGTAPVQIRIGPDGDVYYLSFTGELRRLRYRSP
jgi:glucose/arabinose dehydrogenase